MTQQEFETRTGIAYKNGEFDDFVNPLYMAAGQLDKDAFCKEFKHHPDYLISSRIVSNLVAEVEQSRAAAQNLERQLKMTEESRGGFISDTAYTLIEIEAESGSEKAREKAIKLIGMKEYIRRKIELCIALDKRDLIYLKDEILSETGRE